MSEEQQQTPASSQPVTEPQATPEASTSAPEAPKSYFTPDGGWNREAFGDDLGQHSIFDKYGNVEDLVKATINKDSLIGKKAEEWWTSDDPEVTSKRMEIMGVPSDASEYSWDLGADIPEEISGKLNERYDGFREVFKENGVPKALAEKLIQADAQATINGLEQQAIAEENHRKEVEAELRKEWTGDKYEYNIGKAQNTLEHLGLGDWATNPAFGNDPQFIKDVVEKLVPLVSDDSIIEAKQTQNYATLKDQYDAQYDKMLSMSDNDPSYNREVQIMTDLANKLNN